LLNTRFSRVMEIIIQLPLPLLNFLEKVKLSNIKWFTTH